MIKFKSKFLSVVINIFLLLYQLPQVLTGLIGLAIFHNCELYYNKDANILVLKVNKDQFIGNACFSSGPIIFVTNKCEEITIKHETGHSVQSIIFGPLFHIVVSIPSIILFWIRRITHKDAKWYYSHWPEGNCRLGAEELGHTNRKL